MAMDHIKSEEERNFKSCFGDRNFLKLSHSHRCIGVEYPTYETLLDFPFYMLTNDWACDIESHGHQIQLPDLFIQCHFIHQFIDKCGHGWSGYSGVFCLLLCKG